MGILWGTSWTLWLTFSEQDGRGVAADVVLQVGAARQAVGQVGRALLPPVKVAPSPAVKSDRGERNAKCTCLIHPGPRPWARSIVNNWPILIYTIPFLHVL